MEKPCPVCGKSITISPLNRDKNLVCHHCKDILWLNKDGTLKSVSEEYREIKQRELKVLSVEKERCVILSCDKETPYTKNTHISERKYYKRGVGQLCQECYEKYCPEGGD